MSRVVLAPMLVAVGALAWVPKAWAWAASRHRPAAPRVCEPTTWVRVLRDGEELDEALDRARRYDEEAEAALRQRIERYRAATPGPAGDVVALWADDEGEADRDGHTTA